MFLYSYLCVYTVHKISHNKIKTTLVRKGILVNFHCLLDMHRKCERHRQKELVKEIPCHDELDHPIRWLFRLENYSEPKIMITILNVSTAYKMPINLNFYVVQNSVIQPKMMVHVYI